MKRAYEVIVVGAGPAGSTLAKNLAQEGVSVLLIEREREVGLNILCAEGLSKESLFKFVGGEDRFVATRIMEGRIVGPHGEIRSEIPEIGYILDRRLFDRFLAEEALRKGADVRVGTSFRSLKVKNGEAWVTLDGRMGEEKFITKVVVGACGVSSLVGRSAGLFVDISKDYSHFCAQYYIYDSTIEDNTIEFHVGRDIAPGGYAWVFPKGRGFANVGVGVDFNSRPAINYLNRFVEKRFRSPKILGFLKGIVPIGGKGVEMAGDSVVLVGDAARVADPLSGGGIAPAMESATIAAQVILEALNEGDTSRESLRRYEERYWKMQGKYYDLSLTLLRLWRKLKDEDFDILIRELGSLYDGRRVQELKAVQILKNLFSLKGSLAIILKRGGDVLLNSIRKAIFE